MNIELIHAQHLMRQERWQDADQEIRRLLAIDPENSAAHGMLALSLSSQDKTAAALDEARIAVRLAPDNPYNYYVMAIVRLRAEEVPHARIAIMDAIRLDPQDATFYGVLSRTYLAEESWTEALKAAEEGLRVDPEHVDCNNYRAVALLKLDKRKEAGRTLDTALAKEPDNPLTHANMGWAMLHANQPHNALNHFREALRLDPNMDFARIGIVEAMKARNPIYRVMLSYFLWMARGDTRTRWFILLGGWFAIQVARRTASNNPELQPYLYPIVGAYIVFALLSWTAPVIFDLLLRLDRFGRLALRPKQVIASNYAAACIGGGALLALAGVLIGGDLRDSFLIAGAESLAMLVTVGAIAQARVEETARKLIIYALGLIIVAALALVLALMGDPSPGLDALFLLAWVVFSWVSTYLLARE